MIIANKTRCIFDPHIIKYTFMSRLVKSSVVLLFFICSFGQAFSQRPDRMVRTDEYAKEQKAPNEFLDRLWYGGNLLLGFAGSDFESFFQLGVSPMVGYKITPFFSVGPRLDFIYTYRSIRLTPSRVETFNLYSGGVGPFTRMKVYGGVFVHGEYQLAWAQYPNPTLDGTKIYDTFNNLFFGIGYNSGGSEIYILYNFLEDERLVRSGFPFDFRFGFTYKF